MHLAPSREMLVRTINDLSSGVLDRSDAATWAVQLIEDESLLLSNTLIMRTSNAFARSIFLRRTAITCMASTTSLRRKLNCLVSGTSRARAVTAQLTRSL